MRTWIYQTMVDLHLRSFQRSSKQQNPPFARALVLLVTLDVQELVLANCMD